MTDKLLQAKVDGVWYNLPTPAPENYKFQNTHAENSYRTANYFLIRDIVRRNVSKVFCGWDLLKDEEMALLETLYNQDKFILRCTNNLNERIELEVYAGPLDGQAKVLDSDSLSIKYRTKVQMNFIEF